MDIGSWVKQNKLAAGAIAAVGGFVFLSRKGQGATQTTGVLTPVATAYPNEDMAPTEEAASAADSAQTASDAADAATQAAQDAADAAANNAADAPVAVNTDVPGVAPSPSFIAPPSPSSLTPPAPPPPVVTPTTFPLPGGYTGGAPFGMKPGNIGMLIGNVLGWKNMGGSSNANGAYTTFRFFSDLGNTGDWNYYYDGAKKGEWVGPFNFPRHATGG